MTTADFPSFMTPTTVPLTHPDGLPQVKPKKRTPNAKKRELAALKKQAVGPAKSKRPPKGTAPVAQRNRSIRVARIQLDMAAMLALAKNLQAKELEALRLIVDALNPLPRPSRKRILEAVTNLAQE